MRKQVNGTPIERSTIQGTHPIVFVQGVKMSSTFHCDPYPLVIKHGNGKSSVSIVLVTSFRIMFVFSWGIFHDTGTSSGAVPAHGTAAKRLRIAVGQLSPSSGLDGGEAGANLPM